MGKLLNEIAKALFKQDTGATEKDISWENVSCAVFLNYESKARSLLYSVPFKDTTLYEYLEKVN